MTINPYYVGQFIGAGIGVFLLTSALYIGARPWPPSVRKAIFLHLVSGIIATFVSAVGAANGGPPKFSWDYVAWQTIFLFADIIRLRVRRDKIMIAREGLRDGR